MCKPTVLFDPAATEEQKEASVEVLSTVCPKCGSPTEYGFGLAGGGYGPYVYCSSENCDFFEKTFMADDEA
jgi:hypothetical protein